MSLLFLTLSFSILFWTDNAYAYLDPGAASILIQTIIATIAAGLFTIKKYWYSIKSFFSSKINLESSKEKTKDDELPS